MNASRETAFQLKTTALNRVYKKTYDESFTKEDYEARLPKDKNHPTPEEKVFLDVIETLRGRCRFDNEYKEGATTKVASALMNPTNEDSRKQDFFISDNKLDGANMRVLDSGFDGVFCPVATGNATNQGIVRYLSRGMLDRIDNRTGKVTPLEFDKEPPVCPLIENEIFRYSFFDKWDRIQMSFSNSLTALHIADGAGVGFFNCGGYTFDDGFVVSRKFCEKYPINDQSRDDGSLRPLMAQDKLCDMHGNKGVIAKVFDPVFYSANIKAGMKSTLEGNTAVFDYNGKQYRFDNWKEALLNFKASCVPALPDNFTNRDVIIRMIQAEEGYKGADDEILRLFAENPGMDIVASPYSALSRWNGGIARESLSNNEDLNFKGGVVEGGIGKMNMIVVDMPADVKSHWPSDGTMGHADGAGRKASGQFLWALGSKSCNNIINEIYGNNGFALTNLREYLIALGLDIEEDTSLRVGYHRQVNRNEKRKLYKLPLDNKAYFKQVKLRETVKDEEKKAFNGLENTKLISAEFQKMIAQGGGFLEIPFKLEYSTFRKARINSNTFTKLNKEHGYSSFAETGHSYTDPSGVKHPTYAMPVMSKAVREGFSAVDGSKKPHEYTSAYTKIYLDSIKYIAMERAVCKLKKNKNMSAEQQQAVAKLEEKMRKLEKDAQKQYDDVVSSIIEDKIDTKENLIGKGCMTARIPNAATAVWSADPNLNINEVAMSLEHAKSLMLCDKDGNLKKDASVLLWRDPCLHDANVRYMKVVINNNLLGVAVNPLVDKPFAGDFDGDCVALAALHSYEAKMEAKKKLSMENNLLNFSDYDNDKDEYRLFFASDMDVASNWYANPALKEQYEKLQTEINVLEKKVMAYEKGNKKALDDVTFSTKKATFTGMDAVTRLRQKYANNISRVLKESLAGIGNDMLSFGDKESLLKSYDKIARVTKAKGN